MNRYTKQKDFIKSNFKKYPPILHEDIAWVAFRMLFEEAKDITIDESFREKFNNKVNFLYHLPYFEKSNIIKKWLALPYVYKGDLRNYENNENT